MNNLIGARAPAWLRIVAVLGLLWNLYGVYAYLQTVGMLAGGEAAMSAAMPSWVTGAFALAVFAGAVGCLGLLMLKRWCKLILLLSLLAVLAMDVWKFLMRSDAAAMAGSEMGLTAAVTLVALLLAWLAYSADSKGWLS
jgi:hypothetical protein